MRTVLAIIGIVLLGLGFLAPIDLRGILAGAGIIVGGLALVEWGK